MSEWSTRWKAGQRRLGIVLVAGVAVACAACNLLNDVFSPSSSTSSSTTTPDTFNGTLSVQGSNLFTFTVAQAGTVSVTLSTLSASVAVGLGIGTPSGTASCTLTTSNASAVAGSTAQIVVTENPGSYCVSIYDVGKLTGPATFTVSVAHP
jgi:hypothetical protein